MEKQKKEGSNIKYIIIYWERLSLSLLPCLKNKQRYIYISLLSLTPSPLDGGWVVIFLKKIITHLDLYTYKSREEKGEEDEREMPKFIFF